MNIERALYNAPNSIFDWAVGCTESGFIPSSEDLLDEFGEGYAELAEMLPDCRIELVGEVEDEEFHMTMDDHLKDRGMKRSDFI